MDVKRPDELDPIVIDGASYYSASQVAKAIGISRQTLWRWRTDGKVPAGQRFRNGQIVFSKSELYSICQYATQLVPANKAASGSEGETYD